MPESTVNNQPDPVITTFIPTYRRPELLRRAIQSVLEQTYPHFQVCVYDNASGDETASMVAEMARKDPRVRYHCHSENIGAFNNFQFALQQVDTPYFSIMSDDDYLLPDFYKVALAGFQSHPDALASITDVQQIDVDGHILRMALETWEPGYYPSPEGLLAVLANGHSEWTGISFRKEVVNEVGLLDLEAGSLSDVDFSLRVAAQGALVVSKQPGAAFTLSVFKEREQFPFNKFWAGLNKMVRNLTDNEKLPADVRAHAERVLLERFEKGLFMKGIVYVSQDSPVYAREAAVLLRDRFDGWARYAVLSAIIVTHQYVPFVLKWMIAVWRFLIKCGLIRFSPCIWQKRIAIKHKRPQQE